VGVFILLRSTTGDQLMRVYQWGKIAFVVLLMGLGGCAQNRPDLPDPSPSGANLNFDPTPTPNLTYENFTINQVKADGSLLWKLQASIARYDPSQTAAELDRVSGEFYAQADHPVLVSAEMGAVLSVESEQRLELEGRVEVESKRYGIKVQANQLEWLPAQDQLIAKNNVVITQIPKDTATPAASNKSIENGIEARGDELVMTFKNNELKLVNTDKSQPIQVKASQPALDFKALSLIWRIVDNRLRAEGNIQVQHSTATETFQLTGDTLAVDLLGEKMTLTGRTVLKSNKGKHLTANELEWIMTSPIVEAKGQVKYQHPEKNLVVTGNQAQLNWETNTVVANGGSTTTEITVGE
jgi:LPS export ABC transporter protein LptC